MKIRATYEFELDGPEGIADEIEWTTKAIKTGHYDWYNGDTSKAPGRAVTNTIKVCGPDPTSVEFIGDSCDA